MSRDIQLNPVKPSLTHPEHENTNSTLENVNVTLPSVIFALRLSIDSPLSVSYKSEKQFCTKFLLSCFTFCVRPFILVSSSPVGLLELFVLNETDESRAV